MTTTELERDDEALDERLRAAMSEIGTGYRPSSARADTPTMSARPRPRWVAAAAAATIAAGAAGVWAVNHRAESPATAQPTTVPQAPTFGANFTIPDVPLPEFGVRLDPSLVPDDLPLQNPYAIWVHSIEPRASRWFVATDGDRPVGEILISDEPARLHPDFGNLPKYDGAATTIDARQNVTGDVLWRHGHLIRREMTRGDVDATVRTAVLDAAQIVDDVEDLQTPDGFTELVVGLHESWQAGSDWTIGTLATAPGQEDLYGNTWGISNEIEPINDGVLVLPEGDQGDYTAIVHRDGLVIRMMAPGTVPRDLMDSISSLLELVPVSEMQTLPLFTVQGLSAIERDAPVAGGETAWGRWLAADSARLPDEERGRHCLSFLGVFEGLSGCTAPGSAELTACASIDVQRSVLTTTRTLVAADIAAKADGQPVDVTIEESGGLTFVTVEVDTSPTHVEFTSGGERLCTT